MKGGLNGEIGGEGPARNIGVARGIDPYGGAAVAPCPPQVGGVDEGRNTDEGRFDLRREGVLPSASDIASSIRYGILRGEIVGVRPPRHVDVSRGVSGYALHRIVFAPSDIGGVGGEPRAEKGVDVEPGNKPIGHASPEIDLEGVVRVKIG